MKLSYKLFLALKYGAYTCAILMLLGILLTYIGGANGLIQNLFFIVLAAEIYFCCKEFKQKNEDINFTSALTQGVLVSFFAGLLNGFLVYMAMLSIGTEKMRQFFAPYETQLKQNPNADNVQVEQIMQLLLNPISLFFIATLAYVVFGFVLSIIIAFLFRTSNLSSANEE